MDALLEYQTIASASEAEFKRSNSRFIAFAFPVSDRKGVEAQLSCVRRRFADATHHCSAFRLLEGNKVVEHSNDDREPLNSAGAPILQVLSGQGLLNVLVVVVRYYGGSKLGIGGLIRAYSDAAKAALEGAQVITRIPQTTVHIRYPHAMTGAVMAVLHRNRVRIDGVEYQARPLAQVTLPLAQRDGLVRQLQEACAGQAEVLDD